MEAREGMWEAIRDHEILTETSKKEISSLKRHIDNMMREFRSQVLQKDDEMQKFRDVLEIETKVCHKVINKQSEVIKSKEEYIDILEALIVDHHLTEEVQERIRKGKQEYGKAPKVKAVAFKVN